MGRKHILYLVGRARELLESVPLAADVPRTRDELIKILDQAARKLIDALRIKFNSPVRCARKLYSWDTLVRLKAQELASYILGTQTRLGFSEPKPILNRADSEAIRNRILSMTTAEARKHGIKKTTLWYLQQRAKTGKSFRIHNKIRMRLSEPVV